jgi:hypothetical protein
MTEEVEVYRAMFSAGFQEAARTFAAERRWPQKERDEQTWLIRAWLVPAG